MTTSRELAIHVRLAAKQFGAMLRDAGFVAYVRSNLVLTVVAQHEHIERLLERVDRTERLIERISAE